MTIAEQEPRARRSNSRRMHMLRQEFFEQGKKLAAEEDPAANCWICTEPIDYDANPGTTPDSHELDHRFPVSTHPELQEDPDNFEHSHKLCNQTRGAKTPSAGLGTEVVPDWWDEETS